MLIAKTRPNLPALGNVKGGFNVQSEQTIDCSHFQSEASASGVIQGKFTCKGDLSTVSSIGGTGTSSGSSPSTTSKKGAAASFGVNEAAAGLSVIGGLLQMLL